MSAFSGATGVIATVGLAAMATLAVLWLHDESLETATVEATPNWEIATSSPEPYVVWREFRVERLPVSNVPSPPWLGTVTSVNIGPGHTLSDESEAPISIDGIARPWLVAAQPLFRTIGRGDSGSDVDSLAAYLTTAGYLMHGDMADGGEVNRAMIAAIQAWAFDTGHESKVGGFDPAWVSWLPIQLLGRQVAEIKVIVGDIAPSSGQPWAVVGGAPVGLVDVDSSKPGSDPIQVMGTAIELVIDGIPYEWEPDAVSRQMLEAIASAVPIDQPEVSLQTRHVYPATASVIPASALVAVSGGYCVVTASGPSLDSADAVLVNILGSQTGIAIVDETIEYILANPRSAGSHPCAP